jgi:beta-N-acetylhexosaminidase
MTLARLMIAFAGSELPPSAARRIAEHGAAGVTLFRAHGNIADPPQIRALTAAIQGARPAGAPPLLVAADQEGGQLIGLGAGTTPFAGAMALGATGDEDLARRVAGATARELRALGVNVDYAPVCDIASAPANPALGIRSFGDDPEAVGRLAAATVRGLQDEGVAATAKHLPGAGDAAADPHHGLPRLPRTNAELATRELVPFRAALAAGAWLVMTGHLALPGEGDDLPASLSAAVLRDLLRGQLGFGGVTITDALDMRALAQGSAQIVDAIAALRAGEDVLLGTADEQALARLEEGLLQAQRRGLIGGGDDAAARHRLDELRRWLGRCEQLPLDVVGCAEHQALAAELARRSLTLVRNDDRLLPLRPAADARIAVVQSLPADLTPADTSSTVTPTLAAALRRRHAGVEEILLPATPGDAEIVGLRERLAAVDLVVVGTVAAHLQPAQARLAAAVLAAGRPTVTVALRTPWDLLAYPSAGTHVCSYGILPPSMEALATALLGEERFAGRLPVAIAGLHPRGHGITAWA